MKRHVNLSYSLSFHKTEYLISEIPSFTMNELDLFSVFLKCSDGWRERAEEIERYMRFRGTEAYYKHGIHQNETC